MSNDRWVLYSCEQCQHCPTAKEKLDQAGVRYANIDIMESLGGLKRFMAIRDKSDAFLPIKEMGAIGIPALVKNDGEEVRFDIAAMDLSALPKKK